MTELGRRMYARGFVLRGRLPVNKWKRFLVACAKAMGMAPIASPAIWKYPVNGKGGKGLTLVQPITESFLALDTWSDHDGAYLFVCSCKRFWPAQLREIIAIYGLDEDQITGPNTLSLNPE